MAESERVNTYPSKEKFRAIITDITDSGMRLLTDNPLRKGQKIVVSAPSVRTAIVRWSERFDSTHYTVGLEFV